MSGYTAKAWMTIASGGRWTAPRGEEGASPGRSQAGRERRPRHAGMAGMVRRYEGRSPYLRSHQGLHHSSRGECCRGLQGDGSRHDARTTTPEAWSAALTDYLTQHVQGDPVRGCCDKFPNSTRQQVHDGPVQRPLTGAKLKVILRGCFRGKRDSVWAPRSVANDPPRSPKEVKAKACSKCVGAWLTDSPGMAAPL
jgi:hypothetical protein